MKCRLYHPPLAQVKFTFARQQALAEQYLSALEGPAFDKFMRVYNKQIADMIGMIDEINRLRPHPQIRHIAETRLCRQESDAVTPKRREVAAYKPSGLEWGKVKLFPVRFIVGHLEISLET